MNVILARIGRGCGIIGGALGVIVTIAVLTLPFYEGVQVTVSSSGERIEEHFRKTLIEGNDGLAPITIAFFGAMVISSVAAFVLALKIPKENHRRYGMAIIGLGALLLFGAFITGFSVGAYYFPGALITFIGGLLLSVF